MATRNANHLRSHLSVFEAGYPIQKGYIAQLLIVDGRSIPDVVHEVRSIVQAAEPSKILHEGSLANNLHLFKKMILKKKNFLTREWQSLITLFLEPFTITFKSVPVTTASSQPEPASTDMHPEPSVAPQSENLSELATPLASSFTDSSVSVYEPSFSESCKVQSPRKLRRDCANCIMKQRTIMNLEKQNKRLQQQIRGLKAQQKPKFSLTKLKKTVKRKTQSVDLWNAKFKDVKEKYDEALRSLALLDLYKQEVNRLRSSFDSIMDEAKGLKAANVKLWRQLGKATKKTKLLKIKFDAYKKRVTIEEENTRKLHAKQLLEARKKLTETTGNLEKEMEMLREQSDEGKVVTTKTKGKYNVLIRRCVYECLLNNIAVNKVSKSLHSIAYTVFNKTFSDLPSVSTVAQMAIEVGVLSDIQVGYSLDMCTSATLAWDGTTKRGIYINEVDVSIAIEGRKNKLTMNISALSGGATQQLHDHITTCLSDVCQIYSGAFGLNDADVKERILSKFHSTMTDRAKVNHAVHEELKKELGGGNVVELKCAVHPLDGLASAARRALHQLDTNNHRNTLELKPALGCRAAQLIYQVSKLRFKDGSGDPAAFMIFLKSNNIQPSSFLRYVGNRLHVMFGMAATICVHHEILVKFAQTRQKRQLCGQILKGLMDSSIRVQLQVLGLFSKFLTGPWMRMFYQPEDGRGHLHGAAEFKPCLDRLKDLFDSPEGLLSTAEDAFGGEMTNVQPELRRVDAANMDEFLGTVKCLANEFIVSLSRQLDDYIVGPLSVHSAALIEATDSAPMDNMGAERTLGMMDAMMQRAPHANLRFIDAKTKAMQNDTLSWLDSLPEEQQQRLIDFAITEGVRVRQRTAERQRALEKDLRRKFDKAVRDQYEKDLKSEVVKVGLVPSLLKLYIFDDLDSNSRHHLERFLVNDLHLANKVLRHVWNQEGDDCVYLEMVKNVGISEHKDKCQKVIDLWCWKENDTPSDDFFSMNIKQFLVDFALGDLSFL